MDAILQFQNLEQKDRIDRKEAQIRAGKLIDTTAVDSKPAARGVITLQDSAFGGLTSFTDKTDTHAQYKKDKAKTNKILMSEQNWQLAADRPDLYIPNKLPFFRPGEEPAVAEKFDGLIKLQKTQSHYSNVNADDQDTEVRDLLVDQSNALHFSEHEAILLQLPGTLPFAGIKPHTGKVLDELITQMAKPGYGGESDSGSAVSTNLKEQQAPTIGKLRVMKSGRVIMRIQLPGQTEFVDLELSKGIQPNFYQELVATDASKGQIHFFGPVQHKIVATPDLDALIS